MRALYTRSILTHLFSFQAVAALHVRTLSANHSAASHCIGKRTNSVASRVVTPQECISSSIVSFRFASAGVVGG